MNMPNPYLWRTTITDPRDLYGRKKEIEDIYERIKSKDPQSIAIVSERKMGKSSLLYYTYHEKDKYLDDPEENIFIFIDTQGETINSRDDFFKVLLKKLRENEKLQNKIAADNKDNYENIKKAVSKLDSEGYKLIVFLDEFDLLVRKESIPSELYENLRALAGMYAVAYITATVKSPIELMEECGSPFFNIFNELRIGLFSKEEAMELVGVPSAREGVPLKNEADFVFDIAGLCPFFIQIACSILFRYKSKKERLRKSDYDEIKEKFLIESRYQFEFIWGHLDKKEKEVFLKLAKSKSIGVREKYILENLERKGYVIKSGKRYDIFSSFFKEFVLGRIKIVEGTEDEERNIKKRYIPIIGGVVTATVFIVLIWKFPLFSPIKSFLIKVMLEFSEGVFAHLSAVVIATLLLGFFGYLFKYRLRKYTRMIEDAHRKHPKNPQKCFEELKKIKSLLEDEIKTPGFFGSLKREIYERSYERLKNRIDNCLSEVFAIIIYERFQSLPTNLDSYIEKMIADKRVAKTEHDKFMDILSKSDMKEEDKRELENVIAKWMEKE